MGELDRYEIVAALPSKSTGIDDFRAALRALLEDRFQLRVHRDSVTASAYDLTVAKEGLKARRAGESDGKGAGMSRGKISARQLTMAQLAGLLSTLLAMKVRDATGTVGTFAFDLEWTPDETQPVLPKPGVPPAVEKPASDGSGPSLFTALREQLGLRLEPRKMQQEMIVIDHAERPSEN